MKLLYQATVMGEPVAQGRPRIGRWGAFDPPKSRAYKDYIKNNIERPKEPFSCPMLFELNIYRPIPKSTSKKKLQDMEDGLILPEVKPDVDNYAKGVMDALSGIVWEDDNHVCDLIVRKRYSKNPRIEFSVYDVTP